MNEEPQSDPSRNDNPVSPNAQRASANWVAFAALVVALSSLALSAYVAYLNRHHQRLSVQPYVQFGFYYNDAGAHFSMDNWGLGPAMLNWFRVSVDQQPQYTWKETLRALGIGEEVKFVQSIPSKGVLMQPSKLGQSVEILTVKPGLHAEMLIKNHQRITLEACYCSLYEECWLISTKVPLPEPHASCDPPPQPEFGWAR